MQLLAQIIFLVLQIFTLEKSMNFATMEVTFLGRKNQFKKTNLTSLVPSENATKT